MRFENNARQRFTIDTDNFDEFARVGDAADDAHGGSRRSAQLRQEADHLLVRSAVDRRRGNVEFPAVAEAAGEARLLCAGSDLKLDARFQSAPPYARRYSPGDPRLPPPVSSKALRTKPHRPASRDCFRRHAVWRP